MLAIQCMRTDYLPHSILLVYISLWVSFYLLTHATNGSSKPIDPPVLILAVECIKLFVSLGLCSLKRRNYGSSGTSVQIWRLLQIYCPIAMVYCAYNNLMVVNLRHIDPTTYLVLSSSRLLMTAFAWQWMFGKHIQLTQWISLVFLTIGILIKDATPQNEAATDIMADFTKQPSMLSFYPIISVALQMLCSVAGSLYNEKVLKTTSKEDPHLHNACLYFNSVVLNAGIAFFMASSASEISNEFVRALSTRSTLAMISLLSCIGIVTSLVLRYIDSVAKAVASAAEPAITALVGFFVFGDKISGRTEISIICVFVGTFLYSMAPTRRRAAPCTNFIVLVTCLLTFLSFLGLPVKQQALQTPSENQVQHRNVSIHRMPSCLNMHLANASYGDDKKWRAFEAAVGSLNSVNADYFVACGTLLGFVRECRHFDSDLDFVVSLESLKEPEQGERLVNAFVHNYGFKLIHTFLGSDGTVRSLGGEYAFTFDGIKVDIFVGLPREGYFVNGVTWGGRLLACPKPISDVQEFSWRNLTVRVPMPYHDVLVATYGHDYMVPQRIDFSTRMKLALLKGRCMVVSKRGKIHEPDSSGVLACLEDRSSVIQALALAQSMSKWERPVTLELYHNRSLSYFLQQQLEAYSFVTVVDTSLQDPQTMHGPSHQDTESLTSCHLSALGYSKLRNILLVRPSVIFLQDPLYLVQTMEFVHEESGNCTRVQDGPCVTSTDWDMTEQLRALKGSSQVISMLRTAYNGSISSIKSKWSSQHVASIHEVVSGVGAWAYLSSTNLLWIRNLMAMKECTFTLSREAGVTVSLPKEHFRHLFSTWIGYVEGARLMAMDKPTKWVAFDGGMNSGVLNSLKAAHESHLLGASALNIDLSTTVDGELVAIHNDEAFGPFDFGESKVSRPISSLNISVVQHLKNPCIPTEVWESLDSNRYHTLRCIQDNVSSLRDFIDGFLGVDFVFDLKAPTEDLQVKQARALLQIINERESTRGTKTPGRISVRFFSKSDDELVASILPERALESLSTDSSIKQLPYYVNVPSALACTQIASWITANTTFQNKNIAGCFVVMNHHRMEESWGRFVEENNVPVDKYLELPKDVNMICDVPRKAMDAQLLRDGFCSCVSEGYDVLHYPFSASRKADHTPLPMLDSIPDFRIDAFKTIQSHLTEAVIDDTWHKYASHWGFGSPFDWSDREDLWFKGDKPLSSSQLPSNNETAIFRCVTKLFVVILLLRLEELGKISLEDNVVANEDHNITLRGVISNKVNGQDFIYDNTLWEKIPLAVQNATGLNFLDAMQYFVLDPMGVVGSFDVNTPFPPYAARGFVGPLDDLLLLGSTLSAFGVSPKTQREVLSVASVKLLLDDSTIGSKRSFHRDTVVQSMKRYHSLGADNAESDFPHGVVDGYGLGLWRVNGWRRPHTQDPIRGWLSMGSSEALLYFDVTGLVVAMHATERVQKHELTPTFARVVHDLGSHIDQALFHAGNGGRTHHPAAAQVA